MLDSFFGRLSVDGDWLRGISDRGFAQARDKLSWSCLEHLNRPCGAPWLYLRICPACRIVTLRMVLSATTMP